ncbi:MAG: aromatic ring-hydroxylating dioxygenase subunit alpha [Pseudomonadota bacterium]
MSTPADSVNLAALARTARDLPEARTPPGWVYSDQALFERELKVLFSEGWLALGHAGCYRDTDVFPILVGAESLLVVAQQTGPPAVFFNVCRHRGTRLVAAPQQRCRLIVCPYHGWSYTPAGELKAAPGMQAVSSFSAADYGLKAVPTTRWNGLLFTNPGANRNAAPEFPDLAADLSGLDAVAHHEYLVAANWKLLCENYNECYHCPGAHPGLHELTAVDSGEARSRSGSYTGGPMRLREGVASMSERPAERASLLPGVVDPERVDYYHLFPNLFLSVLPDYALLHVLWPLSPDQTRVETWWLFNPSDAAQPGFSADPAVEFWDRTNQEDWALCENAMAGLRSRGHEPGPYHPDEACVHDFDRWYVEQMFGGI